MPPEERRCAIVDAVVPLLERHGPHVTTRQVAEAAGIAEGTIFRVFPDKRALLLAVAEETVAPAGWRDELAAMLEERRDLPGKVLAVVERMVESTRRLFLVMAALPAGVPPFLEASGRDLLAALTDLVFRPHAAELGVPPERAALALRSLVTGTWHPGAVGDHLTPAEITDLLLHGVARTSVEERPCC